jgi:serine/threonine protein kinase
LDEEDEAEQSDTSTASSIQQDLAGEEDEKSLMDSNLDDSTQMERKGTMVGTVNYMAPEMIKDNAASMATDIWCFGCIIFKYLFAISSVGCSLGKFHSQGPKPSKCSRRF